MIKRINKMTLAIGSLIFVLLLFIHSLLIGKISFSYALTYLLSLLGGIGVFLLSDAVNGKLLRLTKPQFFSILFNISKLIIYAGIMIGLYFIFGAYSFFFSALGLLTNKLAIIYLYLLKEPYVDRHRKIEKLMLPDAVLAKLKENGFLNTMILTRATREDLGKFLTSAEIEKVNMSLKPFELCLKKSAPGGVDI